MCETKPCDGKMEVWTRVVGFYRPTNGFNKGKKEEYNMRKTFNINGSLQPKMRDIINDPNRIERMRLMVDLVSKEMEQLKYTCEKADDCGDKECAGCFYRSRYV